MTAKLLRISGKVQGVFFRESMRTAAEQMGVTGWVRNRIDGTVEAFVQGDPAKLEKIIAWAHQGPPRALVENVQCQDSPTDPAFKSFERRETA